MSSFLRKILLFACIASAWLLILLLSNPREIQYNSLENDYAKSSWVYKNALSNPTEYLEIAIIGSSLSFTNVDDSIIASSLGLSKDLVQNLSVPGDGRNLQYLILKELLAKKKVHSVFLEVRNLEPRSGHFAFGNLARFEDLVMSPLFMNLGYLKDWGNALRIRAKAFRIVLGENQKSNPLWESSAFGRHQWNRFPDSTKLLAELRVFESQRTRRFLPEKWSELEHHLSCEYIDRMKALCMATNTKLILLYQPVVGDDLYRCRDFEVYKELEQWIPAPSLLGENLKLWADPYHLNPEGAKIYTDWFLEKVRMRQKI